MAAISVSRRAASGIALIVAGALFVLAAILPLLSVAAPWVTVLAYLATAVAFAVLGFGALNDTVAKIATIAAAIGWALAVILTYVALPAPVRVAALLLAGVAGLIGAVVIYVGKEVDNTPALVFVVATVLGLLYILGLLGTLPIGGSLLVLLVVLFGAALIAAGVLFRRTEHTRRRR